MQETRSYRLAFPTVLTEGRGSPRRVAAVAVPDARDLVRRYFDEMVGGWRYEASIRQPANWLFPDVLTVENWINANLINARSWAWSDVSSALFNQPLPELAAIEPGADLFADWAAVRPAVLDLVESVTLVRGIGLPNATKLLHQKRPLLIPIFDDYVLRSIGVPRQRTWRAVAEIGFERFLSVALEASNAEALSNITAWLAENPLASRGLALSRVRVLDIIAWMTVRNRVWERPRPLRGILEGRVQQDFDVDNALREIRSAWLPELAEADR